MSIFAPKSEVRLRSEPKISKLILCFSRLALTLLQNIWRLISRLGTRDKLRAAQKMSERYG